MSAPHEHQAMLALLRADLAAIAAGKYDIALYDRLAASHLSKPDLGDHVPTPKRAALLKAILDSVHDYLAASPATDGRALAIGLLFGLAWGQEHYSCFGEYLFAG